jgi:putative transcriptional regulator
MKDDDFSILVASIKEAGKIKAEKKKPSRVFEMRAPDIKAVRDSLKMSQAEFSMMIGVSIRTLQNWEQGRREPDGPARALLNVAAKNPRAVLDALHAE